MSWESIGPEILVNVLFWTGLAAVVTQRLPLMVAGALLFLSGCGVIAADMADLLR